MTIYPAILSSNLDLVQQQLNLVKKLPQINIVQIDLTDGIFVDNLTILPEQLVDLDFGQLQIDLHLMVEEPMDTVVFLLEIQKNLPIRTIIAQIEHMSYQVDFCEEVTKAGWQVGLSLNLHTPFSAIETDVLNKLNIIQCMGIEAGWQGRKFNQQVLSKIQEIKRLWLVKKTNQTNNELLVDGGVKFHNAQKIIEAGATGLVAGSELWQAKDIKKAAEKFLGM